MQASLGIVEMLRSKGPANSATHSIAAESSLVNSPDNLPNRRFVGPDSRGDLTAAEGLCRALSRRLLLAASSAVVVASAAQLCVFGSSVNYSIS